MPEIEFLPCNRNGIQLQTVPTLAKTDFKTAAIFDVMEKEINQNGPEYVQKIKGIFCFKVKKGSDVGVWVVDVKNGNGSVKFDPNGKGDVTLTLADEDLFKLMMGQLNPQQAFFQGKLKVAGNMGLAMKLKELQPKAGMPKL